MPTSAQLDEVLERAPRRAKVRRRWIAAGAALIAAALVAGGIAWQRSGVEVGWRTESVTRQDLSVRVTAVGTVAPRLVVDVGSEQSGVVNDVFVSANDSVTKGQPLAELDPSILSLQDREAHAQVASLLASLDQRRTSVAAAELDWARTESLDRAGALAPADLDLARQNLDQARSGRDGAVASLAAARARLAQTDTNLRKSVIRAPIDGVVLVRNVDPGQSVVAALQAVTLFEVAQGLEELRIDVDVDEADVPRVAPGQQATFTVPAWPDREFSASVAKVHLSPESSTGVVTYRAELLAENPDGALRVGMTATARIEADRAVGALTVPLAALRFAPSEIPDGLEAPGAGQGRVWVLTAGEPTPVIVTLGPTDGVRQAVTGPLAADAQVVIGRTETP